MDKYTIRLSKENGGKLYQTIVESENETVAFLLAVKEAQSKGINIPDEVWTYSKKHKKQS